MKKAQNKKIVITGGSSGIGFAIAQELITEGAKVLITGRNKELLEKSANEIGAISFVSDQGKNDQIDQLVSKVKNEFGKVDILVINAGIFSIEPFEMVTENSFDTMMGINLKGVFFTLQKFVQILNEGASVILISALGSTTNGFVGTSVYNSTRAAVNSLARSVSIELASKGIRVNVVSPGPIETPIFGKIGLPEEALQQTVQVMIQKMPVKRFGTAVDVAKLVSFIASDDASFITGSEYVIDGGFGRVPIMS